MRSFKRGQVAAYDHKKECKLMTGVDKRVKEETNVF